MTEEAEGGRIFFSSKGRTLEGEDEIVILSVGVDIGSSTSHLVFSRIVLERLDSRYVVTTRETFYESDILLTPYTEEETIDAEQLGIFIQKHFFGFSCCSWCAKAEKNAKPFAPTNQPMPAGSEIKNGGHIIQNVPLT